MPSTTTTYEVYTRETVHMIAACDFDVIIPGMWTHFPRLSSFLGSVENADLGT